MSFLAGIISRHGTLSSARKRQFQTALDVMAHALPWPVECRAGDESVLAQASFSHMWQGPKLLVGGLLEAVGTGVQWRRIPHASTLAYLAQTLASDGATIEHAFDQFSCAVHEKERCRVVLCTDSLGMSPIYYRVEEDCLVFSSHQTWFRHFLGDKGEVDWQGVWEYLIIGHNLGERSLLNDVRVLPPGDRLHCNRKRWEIQRHKTISTGDLEDKLRSVDGASEAVYDYLDRKCRTYIATSGRPLAAFLSGGWDSRLLVALFHNAANMARTYTSQQRTRFGNHIISEKKIATEVARFLGVPNEFIAPSYRNRENRHQRSLMVDYATWFHDWAYSLAERLPRDMYLFCDGILGDILLRGLYVAPEVERYQREQSRDRVAEWFHARYLAGFNTYTRGIGQWGSVIRPSILAHFSNELRQEISTEIHGIPEQDFVTLFLIRNRSRRGISPLPRFILGSKGTVVYPFCDEGFLRLVLSIPLEVRMDPSLYRSLMEKSKPGLSAIPSTNTADPEALASYLLDSIAQLTWKGRISARAASLPGIGKVYGKVRGRVLEKGGRGWAEELVERQPHLFRDALQPRILAAIRGGRPKDLTPYRFFLERILMLEDYFSY